MPIATSLVLWLTVAACRPAVDDTADGETGPVGETTIGALTFGGPLPKNVLVITLDTVRKDYLGRYGDHQDTPCVDDILARSVVLDDHRSCSNWTVPAVICLYAGQSPVDMGFEPISRDPDVPNYVEDIPWAPAILRDRGWSTWYVSANGALPIWLDAQARTEGVFDHGFTGWWQETDAPADQVVDATLDMLDAESGDRPFWGHVQLFDPHTPFTAPAEYLAELEGLDPIEFDVTEQDEHYRLKNAWDALDAETQALVLQHLEIQYTAEIRYLDDQLDRLWRALDQRGVLDDTLVLLWTDHGEQFWEHSDYMHDVSMFREEVDLAFGLWARHLAPVAWTGPTTMVDLLPTVFEVLGEALPPGQTGHVIGTASEPRARFGFRYKADDIARQFVDYDGRRLIYDWTGERSYYRSATDPEELEDLYDPELAEVQELEAILAGETARIQAFLPHLTPE